MGIKRLCAKIAKHVFRKSSKKSAKKAVKKVVKACRGCCDI